MIGQDFLFNGTWLSEYDMKMYSPNSEQQFVGREIERDNLSAIRNEPNHYAAHFKDTLELSFLIIRYEDGYKTDQIELTGDDISELHGWLESSDLPKELFVTGMSGEFDIYYQGLFTDIQPFMVNEVCYGLYLKFKCNSQYGYSCEYKKTLHPASIIDDVNVTVYNQSANRKSYVYPIIDIVSNSEFSGDERITIKNNTDGNKTMEIKLPADETEIKIDCKKKLVTNNSGAVISLSDIGFTFATQNNADFISADSGMFYWLRYLYDKNVLTLSFDNCETVKDIILSVRWPIKAGGF